jgi:hypothetical protein
VTTKADPAESSTTTPDPSTVPSAPWTVNDTTEGSAASATAVQSTGAAPASARDTALEGWTEGRSTVVSFGHNPLATPTPVAARAPTKPATTATAQMDWIPFARGPCERRRPRGR